MLRLSILISIYSIGCPLAEAWITQIVNDTIKSIVISLCVRGMKSIFSEHLEVEDSLCDIGFQGYLYLGVWE